MRPFAEDLAAARAEQDNRRDPEWCVLRVIADEYGLTTDPLDERGYQGPWSRTKEALPLAVRLLAQGTVGGTGDAGGMTLRAIATRIGWNQTGNAFRPPRLDDYELDLLERAEALHGGPLAL